MKLKAPQGVGDPCVAGVALVSRDGLYEVEAPIGALLVECFGFLEVRSQERSGKSETSNKPGATSSRRRPLNKNPNKRSPPLIPAQAGIQ